MRISQWLTSFYLLSRKPIKKRQLYDPLEKFYIGGRMIRPGQNIRWTRKIYLPSFLHRLGRPRKSPANILSKPSEYFVPVESSFLISQTAGRRTRPRSFSRDKSRSGDSRNSKQYQDSLIRKKQKRWTIVDEHLFVFCVICIVLVIFNTLLSFCLFFLHSTFANGFTGIIWRISFEKIHFESTIRSITTITYLCANLQNLSSKSCH